MRGVRGPGGHRPGETRGVRGPSLSLTLQARLFPEHACQVGLAVPREPQVTPSSPGLVWGCWGCPGTPEMT